MWHYRKELFPQCGKQQTAIIITSLLIFLALAEQLGIVQQQPLTEPHDDCCLALSAEEQFLEQQSLTVAAEPGMFMHCRLTRARALLYG